MALLGSAGPMLMSLDIKDFNIKHGERSKTKIRRIKLLKECIPTVLIVQKLDDAKSINGNN